MIKVGILGADTPQAGELLRLLLNHPEVDVTGLCAASFTGRPISSCHYGFYGEHLPNFTDKIDLSKTDILFITGNSEKGAEILAQASKWPDLRIVDLSPSRLENMESWGMEYGLSEINRKPLVRGARLASVASPAGAISLISIHPFAIRQLLGGTLKITVEVPSDMVNQINPEKLSNEIIGMTVKTNPDLNVKTDVSILSSRALRAIRVAVEFDCSLSVPEISELFDSVYDDHNFTFTSMTEVEPEEVAGTQKCIVSITKPSHSTVRLVTVGDCRLRGGAGDALHLLNLFFALDEKVGLCLKPDVYGVKDNSRPKNASWFA